MNSFTSNNSLVMTTLFTKRKQNETYKYPGTVLNHVGYLPHSSSPQTYGPGRSTIFSLSSWVIVNTGQYRCSLPVPSTLSRFQLATEHVGKYRVETHRSSFGETFTSRLVSNSLWIHLGAQNAVGFVIEEECGLGVGKATCPSDGDKAEDNWFMFVINRFGHNIKNNVDFWLL